MFNGEFSTGKQPVEQQAQKSLVRRTLASEAKFSPAARRGQTDQKFCQQLDCWHAAVQLPR